MRQISPGSTNLLQRGWCAALKKLLMKFAFNVTRLPIHLDKKLLLPELLDGMLHKLIMENPQKNDAKVVYRRWDSLPGFLFYERIYQTFFRTLKKETGKLAIQVKMFWNFCFKKKSIRYSGPKTEDGCPNVTEELWVTVLAERCLCQL